MATTAETLWNLLSQSEVSWWGDRFVVGSEVAYTLASEGKDLEALLGEMKPSRSSQTGKTVAAGSGHAGGR
jgi:folate-dependent tRNA-U54 methylase TrmFO/GidA